MRFKKKDSFILNSGTVEILDLLGEGGQGEVYLVKYKGKQLAFKYYKEKPNRDFKENMIANIKKGTPMPTFLWPQEFVEFVDGNCGYLMNLRPKNFVSFVSYLNGQERFDNDFLKLKWCIELARSFKFLHDRGYSYQDLNDGSFFFDPHTGDLLICDNDNVTANKKNLGIVGKMRYMAPEIVRGDKDRLTNSAQLPDIHSDRFSLAVIMFLTFCLGNPFEGEHLKNYILVDEKAEYELFGKKILYIYNEQDRSNRPIRGYHTAVINRYPLLPSYIKKAFYKTFVDGLKDRENSRTTELEWLKLLTRYRDELITCSCGQNYAYSTFDQSNNRCPKCGKQAKKICYLDVNKNRILFEPGKCVFKTHLDKCSDEYNKPIGKIIVNKNNPSLWGIKLSLNNDVQIKDLNGTIKNINRDGVIPVLNGLKIKFNDNAIGRIVLSK